MLAHIEAVAQVVAVAVTTAHGMQIAAAIQELQQKPRVLERHQGIVQQLLVRFVRVTKQTTIVERAWLDTRALRRAGAERGLEQTERCERACQ